MRAWETTQRGQPPLATSGRAGQKNGQWKEVVLPEPGIGSHSRIGRHTDSRGHRRDTAEMPPKAQKVEPKYPGNFPLLLPSHQCLPLVEPNQKMIDKEAWEIQPAVVSQPMVWRRTGKEAKWNLNQHRQPPKSRSRHLHFAKSSSFHSSLYVSCTTVGEDMDEQLKRYKVKAWSDASPDNSYVGSTLMFPESCLLTDPPPTHPLHNYLLSCRMGGKEWVRKLVASPSYHLHPQLLVLESLQKGKSMKTGHLSPRSCLTQPRLSNA